METYNKLKQKLEELEYNYNEVVKCADANQKYYASLVINKGESLRNKELLEQIQSQVDEITDLVLKNDELGAQAEVMRAELNKLEYNEFGAKRFPREEDVDKSLSITPSAALREIEARVLEEAALVFDAEYYVDCNDDGDVIDYAETKLREMAAAKRKGE